MSNSFTFCIGIALVGLPLLNTSRDLLDTAVLVSGLKIKMISSSIPNRKPANVGLSRPNVLHVDGDAGQYYFLRQQAKGSKAAHELQKITGEREKPEKVEQLIARFGVKGGFRKPTTTGLWAVAPTEDLLQKRTIEDNGANGDGTASVASSSASSFRSHTPSKLSDKDNGEEEDDLNPVNGPSDEDEDLVKPKRKTVYKSGNDRGIKFSDSHSLHRRLNIYDQEGADYIENRRSMKALKKQERVASAAISKAKVKMAAANKSAQSLVEGLKIKLKTLSDSISEEAQPKDSTEPLQNAISDLEMKILEAARAAKDVVDTKQHTSTTFSVLRVTSESLNNYLEEFSRLTDMVALMQYFNPADSMDKSDDAGALVEAVQKFAHLIEDVLEVAGSIEENTVKVSELQEDIKAAVPVASVNSASVPVAVNLHSPRRFAISSRFQWVDRMRQRLSGSSKRHSLWYTKAEHDQFAVEAKIDQNFIQYQKELRALNREKNKAMLQPGEGARRALVGAHAATADDIAVM